MKRSTAGAACQVSRQRGTEAASVGTYFFVHAHPVMRQPAAPFCRATVSVEPVSPAGFPFCLNA
jgi:hypothetical protein